MFHSRDEFSPDDHGDRWFVAVRSFIRHSFVLGVKAAFTGRGVEFPIFTLPGCRARVVGLILRIHEAVVRSLPAPFTP